MDTRLLCFLVICMGPACGMTLPIPVRAVRYGEGAARQHYLPPGIQVTNTCKLFEEEKGLIKKDTVVSCHILLPKDPSKTYYCSSNSSHAELKIISSDDQDICNVILSIEFSDPLKKLKPEGILYETTP